MNRLLWSLALQKAGTKAMPTVSSVLRRAAPGDWSDVTHPPALDPSDWSALGTTAAAGAGGAAAAGASDWSALGGAAAGDAAAGGGGFD